jgi:hypothetical protein
MTIKSEWSTTFLCYIRYYPALSFYIFGLYHTLYSKASIKRKWENHCRYLQVLLDTRLKSRQVAECAFTHCHLPYGSGSRLLVEVGFDAATCPMAPNLAFWLRWALTLSRVL